MDGDAFVWIAEGQRYIAEAEMSAESFRRHMPDIARVLCISGDGNTDRQDLFNLGLDFHFEHIEPLLLRTVHVWNAFYNHPYAMQFNRMIVLDTDTYMIQPAYDLFELLQDFDFIGAHAPGRQTTKTMHKIPDAFCEIVTGVVGIRRSNKVEDILDLWMSTYDRHVDIYGNNEQGPLRDTLWENPGLWVYIFPPEYHCRFGFGGFARYPVKILHGRAQDLEAVGRKINAETGMRSWKSGDLA